MEAQLDANTELDRLVAAARSALSALQDFVAHADICDASMTPLPSPAVSHYRDRVPDYLRTASPRLRRWNFKVNGQTLINDDTPGGTMYPVESDEDFNLVGVKCEDGKYRPILDVDTRCIQVASSSPNHCHLYFPEVELDADHWEMLVSVLAVCGIVGRSWHYRVVKEGNTGGWFRPPHHRKGEMAQHPPSLQWRVDQHIRDELAQLTDSEVF